MKYGHLFFMWAICIGCLILIACTGSPPVAGGTSTAENGRISGMLKSQSGAPVPMARVHLYNSEGNPARGDSPVYTDTTNADGEYLFESVSRGSYTMQSISRDRGSGVIHFGIVSDRDTVTVAPDMLSAYGTIGCRFTNSFIDSNWYAYIPGTSYFAAFRNREAVMDSIPAGLISSVRIAYLPDTSKGYRIIRNITVNPEEKTNIVDSAFSSYSKKLFLNTSPEGADVADTITGFPVLVRISSDNFSFDRAGIYGADIMFTKQDGTPLPHEIERWDANDRIAEVWVQVDTIFGNNSTQYLNMHWGNSIAQTGGNSVGVFDTAKKFIAVWHMGETPSSGSASVKDRTPNAHDAVAYGAMSEASLVDGIAGKALRFDGTDDYLNAGNVAIPMSYSIGLWVKLDSTGNNHRFLYKDSSYTLWYDNDSGSVRFEHFQAGKWWRGITENGGARVPLIDNQWHYLTGTFDGSHFRLYADGEMRSISDVYTEVPNSSGAPLLIGKIFDTSYMQGIMDEIRIEGVPRSAGWIRLCYMNQKAADALVHY
jgi:hypothetical protein